MDSKVSILKMQGIHFDMYRNIRIFGYTVIGNFFLRIVMYIICGIVMSGYAPNYAVMTT